MGKVRLTVEHDNSVGTQYVLDEHYRSGLLKFIKEEPVKKKPTPAKKTVSRKPSKKLV